MSKFSILSRGIIVALILCGAGAISYRFISNPAKTEKTDDKPSALVSVKTLPVVLGNFPLEIEVLGLVRAAKESVLKAQVSGEVIWTGDEFIPGGFFEKDAPILKIDPADYALDVQMRKAALAQMQAALKIEKGQQDTAKEELAMLKRSTGKKFESTDLALRKPQLEQAQADIDSAQAGLDMAELNLERTTLSAPFNAILTARNTDVGNIVSSQDNLGTLVSTDEYWIDVDVPLADIRWLEVPGSTAVITLDGGRGVRKGRLIKMTGTLNEQSRLAGMIVSVADPLLREDHDEGLYPLILGDYARITLVGKTLKDAARIGQSFVRGADKVWLERDGKLVIQTVEIVHKDREYAYITQGLKDGDRLITSNIITPVDGMNISVIAPNAAKESTDGTL